MVNFKLYLRIMLIGNLLQVAMGFKELADASHKNFAGYWSPAPPLDGDGTYAGLAPAPSISQRF